MNSPVCLFFFLKKFTFFYLFIYLFMTVLSLRFCARAFSSCGKWGPLFIAVRGTLTIAASLVAEHGLQTRRLSSCGSWAQLLRGTWDLPRPGLEPVSPALAGRFSTTAPPGKPIPNIFDQWLVESWMRTQQIWREGWLHLPDCVDAYLTSGALLSDNANRRHHGPWP